MPTPSRDQIFVSYSREDKRWFEALVSKIKAVLGEDAVVAWENKEIEPGTRWKNDIQSALRRSKVAFLMVNPQVRENELGLLLEEAELAGVRVVWVAVRTDPYQQRRLRDYPSVLNPDQPLGDMTGPELVRALETISAELLDPAEPAISGLSTVPRRNPFFTGRESSLGQLHEALSAEGRAVLSGGRGFGKTHTALEYAYRHLEDYSYVFWINANSREARLSSFAEIARLLNLPEIKDPDQKHVAAAVARWLGAHENWLLIAENSSEPLELGRGHVLQTTRSPSPGSGRVVELSKMEPEEGARLLFSRLGREEDRASATKIATQLDGLPLSLELAGAYIEQMDCKVSDYLGAYAAYDTEYRTRKLGLIGPSDPVAIACGLMIEAVDNSNPAAAEMLRIAAFLHPSRIPEEIFWMLPLELAPVFWPPSEMVGRHRAIETTIRHSLLREARARTLEIHPLVQSALMDGMSILAWRRWAERAVRAVSLALPSVEESNWSLCERLLPQAHACRKLIDQWEFAFPEAWRLLSLAGSYSSRRGRHSEAALFQERAERIHDHALAVGQRELDLRLEELVNSLERVGRVVDTPALLGRELETGLLSFERELSRREGAIGSQDTTQRLRAIALALKHADHPDEAVHFLEAVLSIQEAAFGA
jgi:hypothetical protein